MSVFTEKDYKIFERLVSFSQKEMHTAMSKFLKKYYKDVIITEDYIVAIGDIPIALVSHMDTVYDTPVSTLYYDQKKKVLWSPDGLGADDRAGIFAIMSAMILTLCETRTYLGAPLPRLHFASALLTFLIGASTAVSSVIYVATANPTAFASTPILLGNGGNIAVIVGISAYALARCFAFENDLKEKETEV